MLDHYVHGTELVRRLRDNPLGGILDVFITDMHARGYARRTIRDYIREVGHFSRWMADEGRGVGTVSEPVIEEFLKSRSSARLSRAARHHVHSALHRLIATLRTHGMVTSGRASEASPADTLLNQFLEHLRCVRGVSPNTCRQRGHYVREFLLARLARGPFDVETISAHDVMAFVANRAERGQTRAAQCAASSLRAFLRYLVFRGLCAANLIDAVPTVVHRSARLPRHLREEQVAQLLASFDRPRPTGRRDYAIALCLARLGLRIGEVVGLHLEDISWREGTIRIATGKSRRASALPLPGDVGRAIASYIRYARPTTMSRHVFVAHVVPVGRPLEASAARSMIRRAFERAALRVPSKGTHVLRHTVATTMVAKGASLKDVADVLRHRSLDAAAVYARVDLTGLRSVAMPWPEVRR